MDVHEWFEPLASTFGLSKINKIQFLHQGKISYFMEMKLTICLRTKKVFLHWNVKNMLLTTELTTQSKQRNKSKQQSFPIITIIFHRKQTYIQPWGHGMKKK